MPARPPISTNGHRPGENGRPALEKLAICESVCPFFIPGAAYGYTVPPKPTNAHQAAKSLRLAQENSSPGCPTPSGTHLSGPNSALKYPNAHQVGENDRAGAKKSRLGKIYIPELTALPVASSDQIGVGHYGVVGQMAGWRG